MLTMILTLRMNHQKAAGRRHEASNQRREKENKNGGGLRVRYSSNNRIRRPECLLRRGRSRLGARASQQRGGRCAHGWSRPFHKEPTYPRFGGLLRSEKKKRLLSAAIKQVSHHVGQQQSAQPPTDPRLSTDISPTDRSSTDRSSTDISSTDRSSTEYITYR